MKTRKIKNIERSRDLIYLDFTCEKCQSEIATSVIHWEDGWRTYLCDPCDQYEDEVEE